MSGALALQTEWAAPLTWAQGEQWHRHGEPLRGGSAAVFEVHPPSGERLALKVAHDAAAAPRLAMEGRVALLAGTDVVPEVRWAGWVEVDATSVRAVAPGSPGARPALAMRWVQGAPWSGEGRPVDPTSITRDVAEALRSLHAAGYAHGDVSRLNVLVEGTSATLVDLGLAAPLHAAVPAGATLRYLDVQGRLGDARSRDLLALGVFLAELEDPPTLSADDADAIRAARAWAASATGRLATVVRALTAPEPSARPDATWVVDLLGGAGARRPEGRVRGAYLRAREADLVGAPTPSQPGWLPGLAARLTQCEALAGRSRREAPMAPLDALGMSSWLVALVGPAAVDWPVGSLLEAGEAKVDRAFERLAREHPTASWTFDLVTRSLRSDADLAPRPLPPRDRAAAIAELAIAVSRVPADTDALRAVELDESAPAALVQATADALRLRGEAGRGRSLLLRLQLASSGHPTALDAELARRAGDRAAAESVAREVLSASGDPRARAILARLALDRGERDAAIALLGSAETMESAACAEVAVLCAATNNDVRGAREAAARGRALARTPEERARLAGALGYALAESAPAEALIAYREAADHAARAGAVEEEAAYRTGEAATAASEGDLEAAIAAGTRAALLWEARRRPELAARGYLACASAYAAAGRVVEATRFADLAATRARDGADARTELFAAFARYDARFVSGEPGVDLGPFTASTPSDELRLAARRGDAHAPSTARTRLDALARDPGTDVGARLDWWASRARSLGADERAEDVIGALVTLSTIPGPRETRGRAMSAGHRLAAARAHGDSAARFAAEARVAARELVDRAGPTLGVATRELPWMAPWLTPAGVDEASGGLEGVGGEQARELLRIVRSLEGRERLGDLLDRIVDALIAATGVERGLLLLPTRDGALRPRAARRLGRDDLSADQMTLSQTLARRALEAGEPVVAVDASGEMSDLHASVHALRLRSVLAVPLVARGDILGVVYLDDRVRRGAFGPRELAWARTVAALAAMVLAEGRERVLLRREARRASRAREQLARELADRDMRLSLAEARLAERTRRGVFGEIVGESAALGRVVRVAERLARSDVPALILGESGSGKELFARAIHDGSSRRTAAFVSENCSAIPEALLESTLFGHERGAFTGADRAKLGLLHAADGGTLFLDEVGEMSLAMQAKMLRVLEDGMVRPVGGTRARKVDVRIVAATHRDLAAMVAARTFREDLYYRLHIVVLVVPPLRERRDDVPLLVRAMLARHAPGRDVRVSRAAMDRLTAFDWPGNVRQLENEIRRALVLADGDLDVEHLSDAVAGSARELPTGAETGTLRGRIDALEASLVRDALGETGGNLTRAAKDLGVSRFGLQKMLKRLQIERPTSAPAEPAPAPTSATRARRARR